MAEPDRFTRFLIELKKSPETASKFSDNPSLILAESGLTQLEQVLLLSGRSDLIASAVEPSLREEVWLPPIVQDTTAVEQPRTLTRRGSAKLGSLIVVGTGIQLGHVTTETRHHIEAADKVLFLTADEVTPHWITKLNKTAESLYVYYKEGQERLTTYYNMVNRILEFVRKGKNVCVAVYGHPGVFAFPTHESIRRARDEGFEARMLPGISAEDCLFADLGIDPGVTGCQSFEATDFLIHRRCFDTSTALVLWQIGVTGQTTYDKQMDLQGLRVLIDYLKGFYSADHEVVVYEAAQYPICDAQSARVALDKVVDLRMLNPISTMYVPPSPQRTPDPELMALLGLQSSDANQSVEGDLV